MSKRERPVNLRLTDAEFEALRTFSIAWNMEVSEILRCCMALALPLMADNEFIRRTVDKDSKMLGDKQ